MLEQDFRKIDLNLLVVLRSLLATLHVGQTAKRLGMSQPATSRALGALREIFDDRLLVKSGSKMTPTPRALALREPVEDALSVLLAVFEPPDMFDTALSRRRFRLATTDYGATVILPRLASAFFTEAPNADLDIQPLSASSFSELGSNDLDIVLYSDNPVPEALRAKEIYRERFACLARAGHPVTRERSTELSLEDYLRFTHIMVTVTGGQTGPVDRALSDIGQRRRIGLVLPYFAAAALAAAKSDLLLTMPYRAAKAFAETMDLVLMSPPLDLSDFGYRIVWHERVHDDPGHTWFRNLIARHAKHD
ncbi:MAG: LysR family transcriptional regulator [Pseudomonadota bacterium]